MECGFQRGFALALALQLMEAGSYICDRQKWLLFAKKYLFRGLKLLMFMYINVRSYGTEAT